MKIYRCNTCGKYYVNNKKCYYCGGFGEQQPAELDRLHQNVKDEYQALQEDMEQEHFEEVLKRSEKISEWAPDFPDIFLDRFMAEKKCANMEDLLIKGFDFENDANFVNAMRFSSGVQHEVYAEIQEKLKKLQEQLLKAIDLHEYQAECEVPVTETKKEVESYLDEKKKKVFSCWKEIEMTERKMQVIEQNCAMLPAEHKKTLDNAYVEIGRVSESRRGTNACTEEDLHKYQVQIGAIIQESEDAKNAIQNMKEHHPYIKEYKDLFLERKKQVDALHEELLDLRSHMIGVNIRINRLEEIREKCMSVKCAVKEYKFEKAQELLGTQRFNESVAASGIFMAR